jgi:hypothetical protein
VIVTGQFTATFDATTFRDAFINETELSLYAAFTTDNTANSDFIAFAMPRLKLGSASRDDGEKTIVATYSFQALLATNGGAGTQNEATTLVIQDSAA